MRTKLVGRSRLWSGIRSQSVTSSLLIFLLLIVSIFLEASPARALATGCSAGAPANNYYSVTVCLTSPLDGSILNGYPVVAASISVTGVNPGIQRVVFYLDGSYLLTDYVTPFTFALPSVKWADGLHILSVEALMRDGYTTPRGIINVIFTNGIVGAPVNIKQFRPSTGRPAAPGQPFIIAATGDGASGQSSSTQVIDLIKAQNPNLFLYLGDVYEKGSVAEFYNWYGTGINNFGQLRSITNPTIGNHEYTTGSAAAYFDYWDNIPDYYSFNAGGWHFISLDTNSPYIPIGPTSAEYKWLQQDLKTNASACTIVYYHQPLFNIGAEGQQTDLADMWALMAQYGVDIVLNGHDHDYQRWMPLDGSGKPSPNGITEFIAGGGGHGVQDFVKTDSRVAYSSDLNPNAFGVLLLKLNLDNANFSYRSSTGTVLDSGIIPCVAAPSAATPDIAPVATAAFSASATSSATMTLATAETAIPTPVPLLARSYTYHPSADAFVDSTNPTLNFGSVPILRADMQPNVNSYLRFKVAGLTGRIIQARLLIYSNSALATGIQAQAVEDSSWEEASLNYSNAPAMGSLLATSPVIAAGTWVTLDVTAYISGNGIYSFGITSPSNTAVSLAAREEGVNSAQLIIETR